MVVKVTKTTEFIPKWHGNQDDKEPIVFVHKVPTNALRERLLPKSRVKMTVGIDGKFAGGETDVEIDVRRINEEMITGVKNCFTEDETGKRIEFTKVSDMYGDKAPPEFGELMDEVGRHLQGLLARGQDTKNSE